MATVYGTSGDDWLGGGGNTVFAGDGNDTLSGSTGVISDLYGEGGNDYFYVYSNMAHGGLGNDTLRGIAEGPDTIYGDAGNDAINCLPGFYFGSVSSASPGGGDILDGGDGNDTIYGQIADVSVRGGAGDDLILIRGRTGTEAFAKLALIQGDAGNDTIAVSTPGGAKLVLDGGAGYDNVSINQWDYENPDRPGSFYIGEDPGGTANVFLNCEEVGMSGAIIVGYGSANADTIYFKADAGTIYGMAGDDVITQQSWSSTSLRVHADIYGGLGNDTITADDTTTFIRGDEGSDSISGGSAFDDINGNMGNDTAHGNAGDDWVVGGKDNDQVYGDAGADIVYGNLGNDTVSGGDGNDWVRGGQGDDSVSGDAGNDVVWGDRGDDTVSGGAGADTFRFFSGGGVDRVTDFSYAEGDRVVIEGGAAWTLSQSGSDTVVTLSGGADTLVLAGVTLSSLPTGWIVAG